MAKIQITRPQSNGTVLYGSLRKHSTFVAIAIRLDNVGDHGGQGDPGGDVGFKGVHNSELVRHVADYRDRKGHARKEYHGLKKEPAPELDETNTRHGTVIEVAMSHEQFAELITSTGHLVDCTIQEVHGIGAPGTRYTEHVEPPRDVYAKMQDRLERAQTSAIERIDAALESIDGWKCSRKVKEEAAEALRMIRQDIVANGGFAVAQASEEISRTAEAAVSIIGDKVHALEADGRLPAGSTDVFLRGGATALGLPMPQAEAAQGGA